ncbi:DUF3667 domain-containing protein [Aliikangiella sp. G2MR2-5]|uniref:DUF3667 domain-containing protein n=1 Tax=Aliikangiella sp. G2MR2-5 TaxID=2788943 RepID=UPI0018A8A1C1
MSSESPDTKNSSLPLQKESRETAESELKVHCPNCGENLVGPYCHLCGQHSRSMIKFFGSLVKELTEDVLGYDSRIKHTIIPLLLKPGQITLDYIRDRRFYYVLPLRLYLLTSLILILLLQINTDPKSVISEATSDSTTLNEQDRLAIDSAKSELEKLNEKGVSLEIEEPQILDAIKAIEDKEEHSNLSEDGLRKVGQRDSKVIKGDIFEEPGIMKEFADKVNGNWKAWRQNPEPVIKEFYELLPYMMFVLLPLFALILKLFYLFSKRYYVEHLILLIHNHCFVFTILIIQILLLNIESFISHSENSLLLKLAGALDFVNFLIGFWIVIYIFLSMKRVYQQNWTLTISKGVALSLVYFVLLLTGFVTTVLLTAYFA